MKEFNTLKATYKGVTTHQFEKVLQQKMNDELLTGMKKYKTDFQQKASVSSETLPALHNVMQLSNSLLENDDSMKVLAIKMHKRLFKLHANSVYSSPPARSRIKLLCLDGMSQEDIKLLYSLLLNKEGLTVREMKNELNAFLPNTAATASNTDAGSYCANCSKWIESVFFKSGTVCFQCSKPFCQSCQPKTRCFSRLGQTKKQPFCLDCHHKLCSLDANEWMSICLEHLKQGSIDATKTAMGCLIMALTCSESIIKPLLDVAQCLSHNNLPELAMPLLSTILKEVMEREMLNGHIIAISTLNELAKKPGTQWEEKFELLKAADQVFQSSERCYCGSSDNAKITAAKRETDVQLNALLKGNPKDSSIYLNLSAMWSVRDYNTLLVFAVHILNSDEKPIRNKACEVVKHFIAPYMPYIDKMEQDQQAVIFLLQGAVKIEEGNDLDGLMDIEKSAWKSTFKIEKPIIDVVINLLSHKTANAFSTKSFFDLCFSKGLLSLPNLSASTNDRCLNLLFPNINEMQFPITPKWPHLEIIGLNVRGHRKFENAVSSQVKEGRWSEWDAALAYIDYFPACNHPSQFSMCLIYSSLWMYKYIHANPTLPANEKYALTKTINKCLHLAYSVALLSLSPVMKLYTARLSLSILLNTLQLTKQVADKEEIELAVTLLRSVLYNCQFCPLWGMPLVSLSEVALLHLKANRLHSNYLIHLQDVSPSQRPIEEADLRYQLHENDLCHVHRLLNPDTARAQAMEELLKDKNWTWNDVQQLMTSPLSPRDSDGWLIRSHRLGRKMEFSQLLGFCINFDPSCPSIELLVVPTDEKRGKVGLFSLDDINTVLQMEEFQAASFSLDPPNDMETYHPFQKFRYSPKSYQNTDFLHTMFETDYLMKSFSIGSEVSAKPPFQQRSCRDGLLKGLPLHLVEALRPVQERPGGKQRNMHRFWIQADKLIYSQKSDDTKVTFYFGDVEMTIRSHPLLPGSDGKLKDTKHKDDPNSAEARFAADMTSAYNEISLHFPLFGRLQELTKLQYLSLFLKNILKHLEENSKKKVVSNELVEEIIREINEKENLEEKVEQNLTSIEENCKEWPLATDSVRSSTKLASEAENLVDALNEAILSKIVDVLSESCLCDDTYSLKLKVCDWSDERRRNSNSRCYRYSKKDDARSSLISFLVSQINNHHHKEIKKTLQEKFDTQAQEKLKKYQSFNKFFESVKPRPYKVDSNACTWVPAALHQEETRTSYSLCYGGVILAPDLTKGYVRQLPSNVTKFQINPSLSHLQPTQSVFYFHKLFHRSIHTEAYRSPQNPAISAQPKASKGSGPSSYTGGNSGGASSGTKSGEQSSNSTAHPGAAAGGDHGDGDDDDDDSDEDNGDEDNDREEEEEEEIEDKYGSTSSGGYQRGIAKNVQRIGKRKLSHYAQNIEDERYSQGNLHKGFLQVLILFAFVLNIEEREKKKLTTSQKLTSAHAQSLIEANRRPTFHQYVNCNSRTITGLNGKEYAIPAYGEEITAETSNVIYCIRCKLTGKMYVGRTKRKLRKRMEEHIQSAINVDKKKRPSNVAKHFSSEASLMDFEVVVLEDTNGKTTEEVRDLEQAWIDKLETRNQEKGGLNKINAMRKK